MKKEHLFAAITAVALASCSGDDTLNVNKSVYPISFRTSVDKHTRASEVTISNMGSFNVTAIGNGSTYFSSVGVSSSDNGNTWTPASVYYWPSYQLTFYAWSHASDYSGMNITSAEQKITGFTPSQTVGSQNDFLVSCNTGTKEENNGSGVSLNFKHALSQIAIEAKCSNSNMKIEVLGVKLVNMATTADFTFPTAATSPETALAQNQWDNLSGANDHTKSYMVKGTEAITLTSTAQSILFTEGSMMLIPQQLTAWGGSTETTGAYIAVLCRVSSLNGEEATLLYPEPTASDNKDGKYAFTAVPINTNWEPGKKYTYTLDFCNGANGGCGKIAPHLASPLSAEDANVDTNPVAGKTAGYEILGPIKFSASVENWAASTQEDTNM